MRRSTPAPLVCLVGPAGGAMSPLSRIDAWMGRARPTAVPRGYVDMSALADPQDPTLPGPEQDDAHLLPVLEELAACLSTQRTGMGPLRFPRYRTADWLTRQRLGDGGDAGRAELAKRLPVLLRVSQGADSWAAAGSVLEGIGIPLAKALLTVVAHVWPALRLWLWLSGKTRWFRRQRYLAPELSDDFLGFAVRLSIDNRAREDDDQIALLLIHAFLEDLRAAYRPKFRSPRSFRRTARPVALLDGTDTATSDLLGRIADIRNETGQFDPLLIVARLASEPTGPAPTPVADADQALAQWRDGIVSGWRSRDSAAWYLSLRLPDDEANPPPDEFVDATLATPPRPPLTTRRGFLASLAALLLVVIGIGGAYYTIPRHDAGCTLLPWWPGVAVAVRDGECVGYSDNDRQLFSTDPQLRAIQREVFAQNRIADDLHHTNPQRPLMTLVYFAGLSYRTENDRYPRSQADELVGLAMRQRHLNGDKANSTPLLRVVVANGGSGMHDAAWVVDNRLRSLLNHNQTVIGVLGLDSSNPDTENAIHELGTLGVPTVGTTLTADNLVGLSPTYFQVVPTNHDSARMVTDYVTHARDDAGVPKYHHVVVYSPNTPVDDYVETLVDDVTGELERADLDVDSFEWSRQDQLNGPHCRNTNPHELLFYAGRHYDFGPFLRAVSQGCAAKDYPDILADDAVTRFIADPPQAGLSVPTDLPIRYLDKGAALVRAGKDCVHGTAPTLASTELAALCALLGRFTAEPGSLPMDWPSGRIGLAYDVSGVFEQAVRQNRDKSSTGGTPDRTTVAHELHEITYAGAIGTWYFPSTPNNDHTAITNDLGILYVNTAVSPVPQPQCLTPQPPC